MRKVSIVTSANPIAIAEGRDWQIEADGIRVYGPDSLAACIEAAPIIRSCYSCSKGS